MIRELIETRYFYSGVFILTYIFYFFESVTNIDVEKITLFPNLILFTFITLSGLLMGASMQEIDHRDVDYKNIAKELFFSLNPPILLVLICTRMIRQEEARNNDLYFIRGIKVTRIILFIISLFYLAAILIVIVFSGSGAVLFLFVISLTGVIGYELGVAITKIRPQALKITIKLQNFLSHFIGTSNKRIISSSVILISLFAFSIIENFYDFNLIAI